MDIEISDPFPDEQMQKQWPYMLVFSLLVILSFISGNNTLGSLQKPGSVNSFCSIFKANTLNFASCAEMIKQEPEHGVINNEKKGVLEVDTKIKVENLVIYPIKSCGGFSANIWPLSNSGELCCLSSNLCSLHKL